VAAAVASMGMAALAPGAADKAAGAFAPAPRMRGPTGRIPNGTSFRSLRKAFNQGWRPAPKAVEIKKERQALYMHSHARRRRVAEGATS
jgi:hypothetical protein